MTDWIANGESGSSVRAKLNSSIIPLVSGSVTNSQFIELALPTGFYAFKALVGDVLVYYPGSGYPTLQDTDNIAAQVSFDGGSTYKSGSSDYFQQQATAKLTDVVARTYASEGMWLLGPACGDLAGYGSAFELVIYPGSVSLRPYIKSDAIVSQNNGADSLSLYWAQESGYFVGASGPARATHVRIGPYFGDGATFDCNYTLWGVPDID